MAGWHYFALMLVRFGRMGLALVLTATLGWHWMLLQTIAWTAMLADNLQSCSFRAAVTRTFDGKHPCYLCKAIAAGKKSEERNEFTAQAQRLEYPPAETESGLIGPANSRLMPRLDLFADRLPQKPPTPPPRAFLD